MSDDLLSLKEKHPDAVVVMYVNSTAEVKAYPDICCTSANAVAVVESLGVDRVIFLPDEYLGAGVEPGVEAAVQEAVAAVRKAGGSVTGSSHWRSWARRCRLPSSRVRCHSCSTV